MRIVVTKGAGEGSTRKSAFDSALRDAGIDGYNLLELSSVLPPGCEIAEEKFAMDPAEHGHRLYVVLACSFQESAGKKAVAGIGWIRQHDPDGPGVFVEHAGDTPSGVAGDIATSLREMASRRKWDFESHGSSTSEAVCSGKVACAVVAAVYMSEGWG